MEPGVVVDVVVSVAICVGVSHIEQGERVTKIRKRDFAKQKSKKRK